MFSPQRKETAPRSPSRNRLALALSFAAFALPAAAAAQTIQNNGANQTQVRLGFIGVVTNSVLISIVGFGSTNFSSTSSTAMPTHALGTINFGTFSTLLQPPPANGTGYRVALPAPGAVVVATLDALIDYNGAATASLTVGRKVAAGGAPDVPLANLRVASPSLGAWTSGSQGVQVPDFGAVAYNLCTATGDATCIAAKSYVHDLAVFVPDSQAAGPFTTTILYTGTMP
jgi:hypothetical protein